MDKPKNNTEEHSSFLDDRRLVVTLHGIRTFGGWQEQLEALITDEFGRNTVKVINYKYGFFSVIAFIIPFFRWLVVRRFRSELLYWEKKKNWHRIDIIGHSFGTHVLAWALHGIPRQERPRIHTIILAGSVLRGSFPWRDLVGDTVLRVINDCGSKDKVLLVNQLFVLFTGMAGRAGFSGATHGGFRNRFFEFGHSGYFYNKDGRLDVSWAREFWLPLFRGDKPVDPYDERRPPTVLDGAVETFANNAEPVKLAVYFAPLFFATIWIWGLYVGEEEARRFAEQAQSKIEASLVAEKDATRIAGEQRDLAQVRLREFERSESMLLAGEAKRLVNAGNASAAALVALRGLPALNREAGNRPLVSEVLMALNESYFNLNEKAFLEVTSTDIFEISTDGNFALTNGNDLNAVLLNIRTNKVISVFRVGWDGMAFFNPSNSSIWVVNTYAGAYTIRSFDAENGEFIEELSNPEEFRDFAISADRTRAVKVFDRVVKIWDTEEMKLLSSFPHGADSPKFEELSHDGRSAVLEVSPERYRVFNLLTGSMIGEFDVDREHSVITALSSDGSRMIIWGEQLWNTKTGTLVKRIPGNMSIRGINHKHALFSPNGSQYIVPQSEYSVLAGNSSDGAELFEIDSPGSKISGFYYSKNGDWIIVTNLAGEVTIWNSRTGQQIEKLAGHSNIINVVYGDESKRSVYVGDFNSVKVWSTGPRTPDFIFSEHTGPSLISISPDSRWLATGSIDQSAAIWDLHRGKRTAKLTGHVAAVYAAEFNPHSTILITGSADGTARVWDVPSGIPIETLEPKSGSPILAIAHSQSGNQIAVLQEDGSVTMWASETYQMTSSFQSRRGAYQFSFSDDDKQLQLRGRSFAEIWDPNVARKLFEIEHRTETSHAYRIDENGESIGIERESASGIFWDGAHVHFGKSYAPQNYRDPEVFHSSYVQNLSDRFQGSVDSIGNRDVLRILDRDAGQRVTLQGHSSEITAASIGSGGQFAATASNDGTIRLWSVEEQRSLAVFEGHSDNAMAILLSNDGTSLVSTGKDNEVRVWKLYPQFSNLIVKVCSILRRDLSLLDRTILTNSSLQQDLPEKSFLNSGEMPKICVELIAFPDTEFVK
ncbi:WD40 repeat domain-containing protein [Parasedimentitalea marina]|uniref:WD40 repeat domain-containing protein n=1 Tax=Parasedimentitalea marina TaxID=2483033 RepID=A0A3T0N1H2_9RHOB|nr:WD40 repeat domain-containing protein [Parasedimentitalea marina]AZV77870.1 WD40 repeat domain-containing protein [Parasedimentitalea marina]